MKQLFGYFGADSTSQWFRDAPGWVRAFYGWGFLLIIVAALAACQTPAQPGIEVRLVEVPIPQPCLPADQIPTEPAQVASHLTGNAANDLRIVAASALDLRAWGQEMAAALKACAG